MIMADILLDLMERTICGCDVTYNGLSTGRCNNPDSAYGGR